MFNSITVNLLYKIWSKVEHYYKFSIIKIVADKLSSIAGSLFEGSLFIIFLRNDRSYYEDSMLFKVYSLVIDKLNMLFSFIKRLFDKYKESSIFYSLINDSFKGNKNISDTIFTSLLIFSVTTLILNVKNNSILNNNIFILSGLLIVSFCGLILKINIIEACKNSRVIKLIESVFSIEEGDDKWW